MAAAANNITLETNNTTTAVPTAATTTAILVSNDTVISDTALPRTDQGDPAATAVDALLTKPAETQIILDGMDDLPSTAAADTLGDPVTAADTVAALHAELGVVMQAMDERVGQDTPTAGAMSDHEIDQLLADVLPQQAAVAHDATCSPACGANGACVDGRCLCAPLVGGPGCAASVSLTWPTLADPQSGPLGAYRGRFVLSRADNTPVSLTVCVLMTACEKYSLYCCEIHVIGCCFMSTVVSRCLGTGQRFAERAGRRHPGRTAHAAARNGFLGNGMHACDCLCEMQRRHTLGVHIHQRDHKHDHCVAGPAGTDVRRGRQQWDASSVAAR